MERNFYSDNFENFLKGHADKFKMTPSKKVWHGIYNDLHPGRRWPSIAMSMVFIFTLVIIGHLNTNNGHSIALYKLNSGKTSELLKSGKKSHAQMQSQSYTTNTITDVNNITGVTTGNNDPVISSSQLADIKNSQSSSNNITAYQPNTNNKSNISGNKNETLSSNIENNEINTSPTNENKPSEPDAVTTARDISIVETEKEIINPTTNIHKEISSFANAATRKTQAAANEEKIHKPKRNSNVTWTYYIAPSFSYRYVPSAINNSVTQTPRIGYEAGTQMSFKLFKKLDFVSGLQVNFSGYKIQANNTHPTLATLILNGDSPSQYNIYSTISHYGNSTGSELSKLKNYSFEASFPIGLQYIFAKTEDVKFGAIATLQPSVIISNQSYILSSDKRNYLTAPELLRRWNMSTSLTPYVSFSSNLFNWQIGPQVRYQILSTYSKRYQDKEHLVDYGIRLGISKSK